jgi:hypothetical protein
VNGSNAPGYVMSQETRSIVVRAMAETEPSPR